MRPVTAIILTLLFLTNISSATTTVADKVNVEELVAKHLEAIGKAEARNSRLNQPLALDWTFNFTRFTFDYPIEDKQFLADS